MTEISFSDFKGMDNVSKNGQLPKGFVRDAVNVKFSSTGKASRRHGKTLSLAQARLHSLRTIGGQSLCMNGSVLCRVSATAGVQVTSIADIGTNDPVDYEELNGEIVVSNADYIGLLSASGTIAPLSIEPPASPRLTKRTSGGLHAGRYGIYLAYVRDGKESAPSSASFIELAEGEGIQLTVPQPSDPSIDSVLMYRTEANGELAYLAGQIPIGLTSFAVGSGQLGRNCSLLGLGPMPAGHIVRYWRGLLLVARGSTLYFSEPMNYGINDPRHGFVQFPSKITMFEPVESGVFVGTNAGVVFLQGTSPKEWTQVRTSGKPPIPGASSRIEANKLSGEYAGYGQHLALWLAENGYVIGTPDGRIVEQQANRIRLNGQAGALAVHDRRVTAIIK